ncbi:MAG TPA: phage/plasmid primase, P4 family [Terriglobales bacterium]|nr:phage/plasmid primase, P4 family [Terriglobales bacterium]
MNSSDGTSILQEAIEYTKLGIRVIRLHYVKEDGGCSCSSPERLNSKHAIGKHPVDLAWQKSPKLSIPDAYALFDGEPWNLGVATGDTFWVLDYDPGHASKEAQALAERLEAEGLQPTTLTGSGGLHWWFSLPNDFEVSNSSGRLPQGFDVRGHGGQVVCPPSVSGKGPYVKLEGIVRNAPDYILAAIRPETKSPEIGQVDRTAYDSLSEFKRARIDAYVANSVGKISEILSGLRDLELGAKPGWDETCFKCACDLLEIARSPWNAYSESDAYNDYFSRAPRDSGFGDERVNAKFASAVKKRKQRPAPKWINEAEDIPETTDYDPQEIPLIDGLLIEYIALDLGKTYKWSTGFGWLKFNGSRWVIDHPEPAVRLAVRDWLHKTLKKQKDSARLQAFAKKMGVGSLNALTSLLRGCGPILVEASDFDKDPNILNCTNGVVDLRTGELKPHSSAYLVTKMCSVDYEPKFTTDDFQAALSVMPEDVQPWLQLRFGQACTGFTPPDDVLLILQGGGSNGKSSIMVPTTRALGDYFCFLSDKVLLGSTADHSTDFMDLRGARFALLEETPEARRLDVQAVKKVIATPIMTARELYKNNVSWVPSHTMFINTNHPPIVTETDHGTWRRLRMLKYPFTFRKPGEKCVDEFDRPADMGLRGRLEENSDNWKAALAWMVCGAARWYADGKVMPEDPERTLNDTERWRTEYDPIMKFLNEFMVEDASACVTSDDFCAEFNAWLKIEEQRPWANQTVVSRLTGHVMASRWRISKERPLKRPENIARPSGYLVDGLARPLPKRPTILHGLRWDE